MPDPRECIVWYQSCCTCSICPLYFCVADILLYQSAIMAGLKVIPVKTHIDGNLDLTDLKAKADKYKDNF